MKNIFTRALALTIVFVLCAVSAFAAPTFGDVTYDLATGTLDVATSGYTAGKSATILVVKDGADLANLANTDIVYIDQVDNAAAAQSYADLPIAERAEAIGADAINIYIGGSEVTAAIPYKGDGDTVASIAVTEEEPTPEPVVTTAYAVTVAAGEYTSLDEVKAAALTVTKTVTTDGVAAAPVTLAASEYTVAYEDADGTVTITVTITADSQTATTTATYTAPVPPVGGDKTAIAGTVTYTGRNGAVAAKGATIVITDGANIAGYAVADAEGNYEVELPAGTYRAIVNFIRFNANNTFDENVPQIITNIVVTEGATTTKDVAIAKAIAGDLDGDGDVDLDDYNALAAAWTGAK